jgi:putative tryptophan/tyrosine transport system substrate-binding protein
VGQSGEVRRHQTDLNFAITAIFHNVPFRESRAAWRQSMRRRDFITLLGGAAAAWPMAARAQQSTMPVIGILSGRSTEADGLILPVFRERLSSHGFVEGRNVMIAYRYADGQPGRLPGLAADLLRSPTALVVTIGAGRSGNNAIRQINSTIPIVFLTGSDPVAAGMVASLNRPSGNTTGFFISNLGSKRIAILHQLLPQARTIAVLVNPTGVASMEEAAAAQEAASLLGLRTVILNASSDRELDLKIESLDESRPDALLMTINPLFSSRAAEIAAATTRIAIPAMLYRRSDAAAGGLISYGEKAEEGYRTIGEYAARILKGEKTGDLPVQRATRFELVINQKTARTLGLTIPPMLLAADDVIE